MVRARPTTRFYFSFGGNGAFGIDAPGVPSGRFKVDNSGNVGIGTAAPGHDLEIGAYQAQDRFLTFKVQGGNTHMSGVNMWAWQDNYGYSLRYDERMASPNGLHIKSHNQDPVGVTRMFLDWFTGNVGIGTATPAARLNVVGGGGASVDFLVNGRMRSDSNDGGLWVASDRFVGGFGDNIGFWNGNAWRLWVMSNGQVVTQSDLFVSGQLVYASGGQWWHIHPAQAAFGQWWAANDGRRGPSDMRLKTDVRPVTEALDLVQEAAGRCGIKWGERGLSHFTADIETSLSAGPDATDEEHQQARDEERGKALDALSGDRLGLIAQDVEAVLPELVHDDADGYKHVRYQHLTALLAAAIKEQDAVGGIVSRGSRTAGCRDGRSTVVMREQAEQRVSELKAELQKGQQVLAELEARQAELRQTLLRISGAIQVLDELLAGNAPANGMLLGDLAPPPRRLPLPRPKTSRARRPARRGRKRGYRETSLSRGELRRGKTTPSAPPAVKSPDPGARPAAPVRSWCFVPRLLGSALRRPLRILKAVVSARALVVGEVLGSAAACALSGLKWVPADGSCPSTTEGSLTQFLNQVQRTVKSKRPGRGRRCAGCRAAARRARRRGRPVR